MRMWMYPLGVLLVAVLAPASAIDENILCGACHVVAEEVGEAVSKVDPAKTIQVGSFRVDPSGNQKLNEVSYARSDVHLTEVLEDVCDKTKLYMQSLGDDDQPIFIPQNRKDGQPQAAQNIVINSKASADLRYACDTLVEEHEDEILKAFKQPSTSTPHTLCADRLERIYDMHTITVSKDKMYKSAGIPPPPPAEPREGAVPVQFKHSDEL